MESFIKIKPNDISNVFKKIGSEWFLITSGDINHYNTMTASWGGMGVLWNKPVVYIFIRPQRYTFQFVEKNKQFSISFFDEKYRDILNFCGSTSGNNTDKAKETGLKPIVMPNENVGFQQASLTLECRKLFTTNLQEDNFIDKNICEEFYKNHDFHTMYVGEIIGAYKISES